jgi:hypothetical protein
LVASARFGQGQIRQSYLIELTRSFAAAGSSDRRRPEAWHSKTAGRVRSSKIPHVDGASALKKVAIGIGFVHSD